MSQFEHIQEQLSLGADYETVATKFRPIFEKIAAGALAREQQRILPFEQIEWLKQAGFGAVRVPVRYGGEGLSLPQLFQLLTELAKADSNIVQALRGHFAFVEDRLVAHKTQSQQIWFQRFVAGDLVGNAWTEVGNVQIGDVITRVTQNSVGQRIVSGEKYYSTGSIFSDWIDLFAFDEVSQQNVIAAISRHAQGVEIKDDWDGFGQKTTGSGTITIDQVEVPISHILPFDQRFKYQTAFYQVIHLATLSGIAYAAVETFSQEVRDRKRIFSHGNADLVRHDPQVLQVIGKASAQAYASEAITQRTAEALQRAYLSHFAEDGEKEHQANIDAELESAQGQVVIAELVLGLTSQLFNALSASAASTSKQLDRFWRNARTVSSHNPLIYKEKAIGDWEVNRAELPFVWQIGASPQAKSA
ncbi:alkylation response protein AidB-like acyl-CoA dehydrogenase [Acinetobacter baylyi]|uniref:Alkylation response protein AidB-like acyl-CoA dehydrogenase n=1 Tax=Acinetobacter baylyi TaxID=202950 RepID=A0ABU0UYW7_ACIBI|nr:acyl-CoA dehydrogenase family protein [Acinetobacter baylyi]MDQ1209621.1 alkylation response protein AidB-like acyl-CoA dehydrogenase [Acinetobacter baylyi]MDR6106783.1 alkylation response protein AidB-like acyl-CoA dehydrogenase [Acinetobacter baylyi]MDR6186492.1 alkylation response protein AidB-like acyl-CoA dehydrogenase [Acinetobacter baylyi]